MSACTIACRCGHPQHAHTGAWGNPAACTGGCGCSYWEPNLPEPTTVGPAEPVLELGDQFPALDGGYAFALGLMPRSAP